MFRNIESNMHIFKAGSGWVSYLEELKQHVIKVRWHINNRYWMIRLLHCTEGKKEKYLFHPLHLQFIILTTHG